MDKQIESTLDPSFDVAALRDLLDCEVVLIGGGEVVITGV